MLICIINQLGMKKEIKIPKNMNMNNNKINANFNLIHLNFNIKLSLINPVLSKLKVWRNSLQD